MISPNSPNDDFIASIYYQTLVEVYFQWSRTISELRIVQKRRLSDSAFLRSAGTDRRLSLVKVTVSCKPRHHVSSGIM